MADNMALHTPRRFYLLTYPRTASNLLVKMLGLPDQPNLTIAGERGGYVFKPVSDLFRELGLRTKKFADWTEEEAAQVTALYRECWDKFQKELSVVPSHHSVFVKEHISYLVDPARLSEFSFGSGGRTPADLGILNGPYHEERSATKLQPNSSALNLTLLPEEFLQGWFPTFLIRHPALAFPSLYRALAELDPTAKDGEDNEPLLGQQSMTLRWSRSMYEWYVDRLGASDTWPIVLDADDIMESPELVATYCRLLDMDPDKLRFSWDPSAEDEMAAFPRSRQKFQATLMASRGVQKDKIGAGIVLEKELDKWHKEFGPRVAQSLEKLVTDAMEDYEYLKIRRLRSNNT